MSLVGIPGVWRLRTALGAYSMSIEEAAKKMEDGNFIEVPVLDDHGQEKVEKYHLMVSLGPVDGVRWSARQRHACA